MTQELRLLNRYAQAVHGNLTNRLVAVDFYFYATVLGTTFSSGIVCNWVGQAFARYSNDVGLRHALGNQMVGHCYGTTLGQLLVVSSSTYAVSVTSDGQSGIRCFSFQLGGQFIEGGA